jgi:flagellar basal body-associated protein FliL
VARDPATSSRTIILVLCVILALAVLTLLAITVWHNASGGGPISIGFSEPPPKETAPELSASAPATATAPAAPRPARPKPKDDIYDEVEKEKNKR